jgi:hypothetical protein
VAPAKRWRLKRNLDGEGAPSGCLIAIATAGCSGGGAQAPTDADTPATTSASGPASTQTPAAVAATCAGLAGFAAVTTLRGDVAVAPAGECSVFVAEPNPSGGLDILQIDAFGHSQLLELSPTGDITRLMATSAELTALATQGERYYLGGHRDDHGLLTDCRDSRCTQHALPDTVSIVPDIVPLSHGLAVAGHTLGPGGAPNPQVVHYRETGQQTWVADTPHGTNARITSIGDRLYAVTETANGRSSLYEQRVPGRSWRLLNPAPLPGEVQFRMVPTGHILWLVGASLYRLPVAPS